MGVQAFIFDEGHWRAKMNSLLSYGEKDTNWMKEASKWIAASMFRRSSAGLTRQTLIHPSFSTKARYWPCAEYVSSQGSGPSLKS
jgi:hypothetical protein